MTNWTDPDVMDKIDRVRWITHNSDEPPELAPAVLVMIRTRSHPATGVLSKVDVFCWKPGTQYRVLRNPDGHPYVSADGLEPWARWVATDQDGWELAEKSPGKPCQFESKPSIIDDPCCEGMWMVDGGREILAPESHKHPGDWRDSLCEVWREDYE